MRICVFTKMVLHVWIIVTMPACLDFCMHFSFSPRGYACIYVSSPLGGCDLTVAPWLFSLGLGSFSFEEVLFFLFVCFLVFFLPEVVECRREKMGLPFRSGKLGQQVGRRAD